jgi:hypothetical protein
MQQPFSDHAMNIIQVTGIKRQMITGIISLKILYFFSHTMPDLNQTYARYDQGMLQAIAEKWAILLQPAMTEPQRIQLICKITQGNTFAETFAILSESARQAMLDLKILGGTQPWVEFARRYGDIRVMGSARRNRERPDHTPINTAEELYYAGMIGKEFLPGANEPQEYAFIPREILLFLKSDQNPDDAPPGHAALSEEIQVTRLATTHLIDDACTFLAAKRCEMKKNQFKDWLFSVSSDFLFALLQSCNIIDASGMPDAQKVRTFLEISRSEALHFLYQNWLVSSTVNELRLLDGLIFEGTWENHPQPARQTIIDLLRKIPADTWWDLESFVQDIKKIIPDFQRPAGDYDSWYIRSAINGQYLRGFSSWDEVDGFLIRFLIIQPLHLLGLVDLASLEKNNEPIAFRWTRWASSLLDGHPPSIKEPILGKIHLFNSGLLTVPRSASRPARYQIARFCQWENRKGDDFRYRISPAGFQQASRQGLSPAQLIPFLHKVAENPLPPGILQAVEHWDKTGTTTHMQTAIFLRLENPETMEKLQHSRAARFINEVITPTTCLIKKGSQEIIRDTLAELGYLMDIEVDV